MSNPKYWTRISTHTRIGMGSFRIFPRTYGYYISKEEGEGESEIMFSIGWLWFEIKVIGGRNLWSQLMQEAK